MARTPCGANAGTTASDPGPTPASSSPTNATPSLVEATSALHEEVGPARTTVAAIAERAGVSRPTVYAQFPDNRWLFAACGARFDELHPSPRIDDLSLEQALVRLYEHYAENRRTLGHIDRDARTLPALEEVMRPVHEYLDAVAAQHAEALGGDSRTVIRLALEFTTWERLDGEGLSPAAAASLMARVARCAARG